MLAPHTVDVSFLTLHGNRLSKATNFLSNPSGIFDDRFEGRLILTRQQVSLAVPNKKLVFSNIYVLYGAGRTVVAPEHANHRGRRIILNKETGFLQVWNIDAIDAQKPGFYPRCFTATAR